MHRGKIIIDVEIKDDIGDNIFVNELKIEGDTLGIAAAFMAGAYGAFDPDRELESQMASREIFQKAMATAFLNGTLKLMGNQVNLQTINALSSVLKVVTDTNINTLREIVKNTNLKKTDDDKRIEQGDKKGRTGNSSFSDFS